MNNKAGFMNSARSKRHAASRGSKK